MKSIIFFTCCFLVDGANYYSYGLQKSYIQPNGDYGIGHKGRDLGYSANLFYFRKTG